MFYILGAVGTAWAFARYALYHNTPAEYPKVSQGRCRQVKLTSEMPLAVHIDGEFFCLPEDNIRSLEINIVPAALTIARLIV